MRGLELFSGAGGLSTGFELSGYIDTKWAVEFSPSCCLSYSHNKPHTKVYNQDTNLLLQHAIQIHEGKNPKPLRSVTETLLPAMPQPGDVDFIYGGLPCQSFSGANHYKRADDVRNTLVCNMMSYVEFYKPKFFLLENVVGLVHFPLQGKQVGRRLVDGMKQGVVKFILRSLVSLGYQVHFKILQAGHYGAPQGRRRVIFWGAQIGIPLPRFPLPTHCFEKQSNAKLANGKQLYPVTRAPFSGDIMSAAALYAVTVEDAISDLPPFDWVNPHIVIPRKRRDTDEENERAAAGIDAFEATKSHTGRFPGYPNGAPYASEPRTLYQSWMRRDSGQTVNDHYTGYYSHAVIERTVNVPLEPDADYRDLPQALALGKKAAQGKGNSVIQGLYARTALKGFFRTATTTVRPNSQGSSVLHPTQKRVLTVRECARSQGFPDHWKFKSVNDTPSRILGDQLRQIGNAVPIPLARALGEALGDALVKMWEQEADEEEDGQSVEVKEELRSGSVEL
ncbi:S-adenosyl-L-methionine-dependent methyltransferase [Auriscalpium vulgare]|uniref:S-adenosyl-L-methionine-dependent methyltransferase n=1 Tax=Auriscalpium vulgare TaxID=40419 RepID=A0ACB8R5X8_9AGAM|nr:S-adenosyl-L-methionine-dependent methyltransferase [Auriscalpium vulgare]